MNIREFIKSDAAGYVALQNICIPNQPISLPEFLRDLEILSSELQHHIFLAERNHVVVGAANIYCNAGSYHPQQFSIELFVHPDNRNQGIGAALYRHLQTWLKNKNPTRLSTHVRETEAAGLHFATTRGFKEIKRDFESLLEVQTFRLSKFQNKATTAINNGYEIKSFEELDSVGFRKEFHEVFEEVRIDVPRSQPPARLSFEFFEENIPGNPEFLRSGSFFALKENQIAGFSGSFFNSEKNWIDQWLTATQRQHRNQGIAWALKLRVIEHARTIGAKIIRTDNDTRNAAMLAINNQLGFVPQTAVLAMAKLLEEK